MRYNPDTDTFEVLYPLMRQSKYFFIFLIYYLVPSPVIMGQKEVNTWYFGKSTGLDFTGGVPVVLTNSAMDSWEGCASISDNCTGQLLFYTNGVSVWDKNHNQMPNGFNLMGGIGTFFGLQPSSSTQSSLIVPKPGNKNLYYIFTTDAYENNCAGGFRYSIVDMSLNGGLGDVTVKNILLFAPGTEKITGVHHSNKADIWVVSHGKNDNKFYAYLVTALGVSVPVISGVGSVDQFQMGYMRLSTDGKHIVNCDFNNFSNTGTTELFDFNNTTGIISNPVAFGTINYYGAEFSPDSKKLYLASSGKLDQYDVSLSGAANIIASKQDVNLQRNSGSAFAMQKGSDGKIYATKGFSALHVINNPNLSGTACNVVKNQIALNTTCNLGITNFVESFFDPVMFIPRGGLPPATILSENTCVNAPVSFSINSSAPISIDSVRWDFGDIASGTLNTSTAESPSHIYTTAGSYLVQLIRFSGCGFDTTYYSLQIKPETVISINDTTLCYGSLLNLSSNVPAISYLWQNGNTSPFLNVSDPGTYWLEITDECGTYRDSAEIIFEDCEATLFVPNAFTPGASVINNLFNAKGSNLASFHINIFDRWGNLIFESNDINEGWDGTYKGNKCQQDVYVWKITYESIAGSGENIEGDHKLQQAIGHVTLLR